jgi:hypothetical protein
MFLRMNIHILMFDVFEVVKLNLPWESFIPKRPTMLEYNTNDEDTPTLRQMMNTRLNVHI